MIPELVLAATMATAAQTAPPPHSSTIARVVKPIVETYRPSSTNDPWMDAALWTHGVMAGADMASTIAAIESGHGREGNPIWAWWFNGRPQWGIATAANVGMTAGMCYGFRYVHNRWMRHRRWSRILWISEVVGLAAWRAYIVKHNLSIATGK